MVTVGMKICTVSDTNVLPSFSANSCETWSLSPCDEKRVGVSLNNAFTRKIFNAYWHGSVNLLQYYCPCLHVCILLPMKKLLFWKKMLCSGNLILCRLAKCVMLVCLLWLLNTTLNLMTLFVLVLHVSRTVFGVIFSELVEFVLCVFLYLFVLLCVFIFHAAFVRSKPMMMITPPCVS